ncbi:MAG TPA: response regulator, partial [bacterium]|nr:response regulator [bacterium]
AEEQDVSINSIVSIVITDIEMPQMDGYTLTNKIKTDNVLQKLPVIMHTSLSGDNVKLRGKEVGADEYITKFSVEHIKATLDKVIKQFYPN